jgi:hypothetical protein
MKFEKKLMVLILVITMIPCIFVAIPTVSAQPPTYTHFSIYTQAEGTAIDGITHQAVNIRLNIFGSVDTTNSRLWILTVPDPGQEPQATFQVEESENTWWGIYCSGGAGIIVPSFNLMILTLSFPSGARFFIMGRLGSFSDGKAPITICSPVFRLSGTQVWHSIRVTDDITFF